MVSKTLDTGRRLGELQETLGLSVVPIQKFERAIEETNGNADAFADTTLRLQKSIGRRQQRQQGGPGEFQQAGPQLDRPGQRLTEEALKQVIGRTNETQNASDGAATKAALLGRSFTNLGGFANLTTDEIGALIDKVGENAVVMTDEGVKGVNEFDESHAHLARHLQRRGHQGRNRPDPHHHQTDGWAYRRRSRY